MDFEIARLGDLVFTIKTHSGELIRPAEIHQIVRRLEQEFRIDSRGIRFFWPDDDEIDIIVAILREAMLNDQVVRPTS
jgi:hypothetical protein